MDRDGREASGEQFLTLPFELARVGAVTVRQAKLAAPVATLGKE